VSRRNPGGCGLLRAGLGLQDGLEVPNDSLDDLLGAIHQLRYEEGACLQGACGGCGSVRIVVDICRFASFRALLATSA
jgi:hypothetical protein